MYSSGKGIVLWFCGLSGSGKTTIANGLSEELVRRGKKVTILDGDVIRNSLHKHLGFSPEDIRLNNKLISEMCLGSIDDYDFILVPIISPFRSSRSDARTLLKDRFIEVYVNSSLATCIKRDVKGHYKKALAGELENFIGISRDVPFEPPVSPDIEVDSEYVNPYNSVRTILHFIKERNLL